MYFIAASVSIDLALISTGLGIIVSIITFGAWCAKSLNAIDNRFIAIESRNDLSMHKTKSALKFLNYEINSIKGYLSRSTDFKDRGITPNTGADFLNEN